MVYYVRIQAAHWNRHESFLWWINETLNKTVNKYDNIFIAEDLNIDAGDKSKDTNNYLQSFKS